MKKGLLVFFAAIVGLVGSPALFVDRAAQAQDIPNSQRLCSKNEVATSSTTFVPVPANPSTGTVMQTSFNNATTQNVVLTFSSESKATGGAILLVHYRIDGVDRAANGPEFFSNKPTFDTTTSVMVYRLGPGFHSVIPIWRSSDGAQTVTLGFRCLIAETSTE